MRRGVRPDAVTDQTSAHDPVNGYLPAGWTLAEWRAARERDPQRVAAAAKASMVDHVAAMLAFHRMGIPTFDYGNNIRQMANDAGLADAFAFPGFVPAYIRPLFCRGVGPFRWVALSGDPDDIAKTDAKVKELLPHDANLHRWLDMARERIAFQGLPARICWIGLGDRDRVGLAFNEMVARGELKAPIVIGRDHLDSGSVASPNRETEGMKDGTDAVSDWPLLNAMLNVAGGASWVSFHHGGGVGIGFSQHAGMVIVADGTDAAARRIAPRAVERSRQRGRAPRRRRLRRRDRLRARARAASADDRAARRMSAPALGAPTIDLKPGELRAADVRTILRDGATVRLDASARGAVDRAAAVVASIAAQDASVYGVNTGSASSRRRASRATSWPTCSATSFCRMPAESARRCRARSCG